MGLKPRPTSAGELRLALPKGRILGPLSELFARAKLPIDAVGSGRKLSYQFDDFVVLLVRGSDVPAYVRHGVADMGICGRDVIFESGVDVFEPLDLNVGKCRMVLAKPKSAPSPSPSDHLRIASKYPRITRQYVSRKGYSADIVKLSGAVELAASSDLADYIVDITETGKTLEANGLEICDDIMDISSRLVVNLSSYYLNMKQIDRLVGRLRRAVK